MKARALQLARWSTSFDVITTVYFIGLACWLGSVLAGLVGAGLLNLAYSWFALLAFSYTLVAMFGGLLVDRVDDRRRRAEQEIRLLDDLAAIRARTAARRAEVLGDEAESFSAELRAAKQVEP